MKKTHIIPVGFAMFAMLFGSGNVIFPLALGRDIGQNLWIGLLGFCLMAVVVPLIGLISTMLADGDFKKFLGKLGPIPAYAVILVCMVLIGPFGITPRCITIAHSAIKMYAPQLSLRYFSIIAACLILSCTIKRSTIIDLLGKYLGPLKLILLLSIVVIGLFNPSPFVQVGATSLSAFLQGLNAGYGTVDLLGTIFFAGLIFSALKRAISSDEQLTKRQLAILGLKSGLFGALLLGLVYAGFCIIAAFWGNQLVGVPDGDIFSVLTAFVLGAKGGLVANITVAISCLTTAIALTVVFASYLHKEIVHEKIPYFSVLLTTILATTIMSNKGFEGIMSFIMPCVWVIYPSLIVLSIVHIAHVLFNFKFIKTPVFITFVLTLFVYYGNALIACCQGAFQLIK